MGYKKYFIAIQNRLLKTELFMRPSKLLPGKWKLYEYYYDKDKELVHFVEEQLIEQKQFFVLELLDKNVFKLDINLALPVISKIKPGNWSRYRNFITLIDSSDFRGNTEFQFAFEKGNLKLLKKNRMGKIEFFGFFKREIIG
jgi:hypothetical protein